MASKPEHNVIYSFQYSEKMFIFFRQMNQVQIFAYSRIDKNMIFVTHSDKHVFLYISPTQNNSTDTGAGIQVIDCWYMTSFQFHIIMIYITSNIKVKVYKFSII